MSLLAACCAIGALSLPAAAPSPVTTAFTYQGRLNDAGIPADGAHDLSFTLWDAPSGGAQIGLADAHLGVPILDGLFTVVLNATDKFGPSAFIGDARWVEISVNGTPLSPRQPLTAVPFAIHALGGTGSSVWAASGSVIYNTNSGDVGVGTQSPLAKLHVSRADIALTLGALHSDAMIVNGGDGVLGIYSDAAGGAGNGSAIALGEIGAGLTDKWGIFRDTFASGSDLHISYGTDPDYARNPSLMTFDAASRGVGIGTTSPAARLHVAGGRGYFADGVDIGAQIGSPYKLAVVNQTDHAIFGKVEADSGSFAYGVYGQSDSQSGGGGVFGIAPIYGVRGLAVGATGTARGGEFTSNSTNGEGVFAYASADSGLNYGIRGRTDSPGGFAGYFEGRGYFSNHTGIGTSNPAVRLHIEGGTDSALAGGGFLVAGSVSGANLSIDNNEIMARNNGAASDLFLNHEGGNVFLAAGSGSENVAIGTTTTSGKLSVSSGASRALYVESSYSFATAYIRNNAGGPSAVFQGDVNVYGQLTKTSGSFRIDHPLDPANKYLYHSFVESPDMKNLYDGVVVTDERGYATIEMPDWFEALNRDFRYQLTVVDEADGAEFVLAKVVREITDRRFAIRTSRGGTKVSWQVTGTRHDRWAQAHRIPVEEQKPDAQRGKYQHPELYGQPQELRPGAKTHAAAINQSTDADAQ